MRAFTDAEVPKCVVNTTIVDVEEGSLIPDRSVLVEGGRIREIAPQSKLSVPDGALHIDAHDLYAIPGLVDAHVHFLDPSTFGPMMIAHGVVLVRDMGNSNEAALMVRESLRKGERLGPEMVTTGWVLDGDPPLVAPISVACKTPDEGRMMVRRQAEAGVDQVKVYSGLNRAVFLAIVDEALKRGLKPVGHVPESVPLEEAATAGQRSCEHLFGFEKVIAGLLGEPVKFESGGMAPMAPYFARLPEVDRGKLQGVLRRVRDSGMAVCPTVVAFKHGAHVADILAGNYPMLEYASPMLRDIWQVMWSPSTQEEGTAEEIWPHMQSLVKELQEAGVTLMVGTDLLFPGLIPGYSVHEEMALWQDAGIAPADVLRSATLVPARFAGLDDQLGTVEEGKTASLVLLRADPLEDIRNVRQIEGVFLRGKYFGRTDLDRLLQETRDLCQR